jgi:hypothetical protein
MDVKSVFLHGDLFEDFFMEQPLGFVSDSNLVCRLKKSLYGLKQTLRLRYAKLDHFFLNLGFKCCKSNHGLYVLHDNGDTLIVVEYVDDLVITSNNIDLLFQLKRQIYDSFDMIYRGLLHYFLGLQVLTLSNRLFLSQFKYVTDLLTRFSDGQM